MDKKIKKNNFDYIVIGGGMAGLSFSYEMKTKGYSTLILEKDVEVGGLSKTLQYKNFRFDYCAHRFHSANEEVMKKVKKIMANNFYLHNQKSRIFMFDKFLKYPFQLQNFFRAAPIHQSIMSAFSFFYSTVKRFFYKKYYFISYKDWFEYFFGKKLYELMAKDYTSKIWKIDPACISADWANQRFQQVNVLKLVNITLKKIFKFDFSSYSLKDQALAPDGGEFWYPINGIQDIPDTYANLINAEQKEDDCACKIYTGAKLERIDIKNKKVFYKKNNLLEFAFYNKAIISTIPIYSLYESLDEKNEEVSKSISDLRYMDIIFVYLMIDKDKISDDHWLYFSDKNIIFNRAVEFKNWSKKMSPENQTSLCLDITCYRSDKSVNNPWNYSKKDLTERCIDDCVKIGLLEKKDISDTLVIKVKDAYPFYDLHYKKRLEFIISFLEKSKDIFCIGRTGLFSYNNSDGSIEMGINLAKNLSINQKDSFLDYKFRKNSF